MSGLLDAYKGLITSQHRGKPKYMATVESFLQYCEDIYATAVYLDDEFDLDLAVGVQEDVLGILVGASRELDFQPQTQPTSTLNDEDYRILLKAKIAKNMWKGGIEDLQTIWRTLFDEGIIIIDNQDMTIEVIIDKAPSNVVREMIARGMIVPKPQSVRINYNFFRTLEGGFYIGGFLNRHTKTVVSPALPEGGDIITDVHIGGALSTHRSSIVGNAIPDGGNVVVLQFMAGKTAQHHKVSL